MTRALRSLLAEFNRTGHYMYLLEDGFPQWTSNGYVAIKQVVNPTSRKADILDKMPDISLFLVGNYRPAFVGNMWPSNGRATINDVNGQVAVVDAEYCGKIFDVYPDATIEAAHEFDPVRFLVDGEVVALLMPIKP